MDGKPHPLFLWPFKAAGTSPMDLTVIAIIVPIGKIFEKRSCHNWLPGGMGMTKIEGDGYLIKKPRA
jgi:hypothetical protein